MSNEELIQNYLDTKLEFDKLKPKIPPQKAKLEELNDEIKILEGTPSPDDKKLQAAKKSSKNKQFSIKTQQRILDSYESHFKKAEAELFENIENMDPLLQKQIEELANFTPQDSRASLKEQQEYFKQVKKLAAEKIAIAIETHVQQPPKNLEENMKNTKLESPNIEFPFTLDDAQACLASEAPEILAQLIPASLDGETPKPIFKPLNPASFDAAVLNIALKHDPEAMHKLLLELLKNGTCPAALTSPLVKSVVKNSNKSTLMQLYNSVTANAAKDPTYENIWITDLLAGETREVQAHTYIAGPDDRLIMRDGKALVISTDLLSSPAGQQALLDAVPYKPELAAELGTEAMYDLISSPKMKSFDDVTRAKLAANFNPQIFKYTLELAKERAKSLEIAAPSDAIVIPISEQGPQTAAESVEAKQVIPFEDFKARFEALETVVQETQNSRDDVLQNNMDTITKAISSLKSRLNKLQKTNLEGLSAEDTAELAELKSGVETAIEHLSLEIADYTELTTKLSAKEEELAKVNVEAYTIGGQNPPQDKQAYHQWNDKYNALRTKQKQLQKEVDALHIKCSQAEQVLSNPRLLEDLQVNRLVDNVLAQEGPIERNVAKEVVSASARDNSTPQSQLTAAGLNRKIARQEDRTEAIKNTISSFEQEAKKYNREIRRLDDLVGEIAKGLRERSELTNISSSMEDNRKLEQLAILKAKEERAKLPAEEQKKAELIQEVAELVKEQLEKPEEEIISVEDRLKAANFISTLDDVASFDEFQDSEIGLPSNATQFDPRGISPDFLTGGNVIGYSLGNTTDQSPWGIQNTPYNPLNLTSISPSFSPPIGTATDNTSQFGNTPDATSATVVAGAFALNKLLGGFPAKLTAGAAYLLKTAVETAAEYGASALEAARENPILTASIGVGAAGVVLKTAEIMSSEEDKEPTKDDKEEKLTKAWFDILNQSEKIEEKQASFLKKHPQFDRSVKNADGKTADEILLARAQATKVLKEKSLKFEQVVAAAQVTVKLQRAFRARQAAKAAPQQLDKAPNAQPTKKELKELKKALIKSYKDGRAYLTKDELNFALSQNNEMAYISVINILSNRPDLVDMVLDGKGNTVAHIAVKTRNLELLQGLFNLGADLNATNEAGEKPVDIARADQPSSFVDKFGGVGDNATDEIVQYLETVYPKYQKDLAEYTRLVSAFSDTQTPDDAAKALIKFADSLAPGYRDLVISAADPDNITAQAFARIAAHEAELAKKVIRDARAEKAKSQIADLSTQGKIDERRKADAQRRDEYAKMKELIEIEGGPKPRPSEGKSRFDDDFLDFSPISPKDTSDIFKEAQANLVTKLMQFTKDNNTEKMDELLKAYPNLVNADRDGNTAMHIAASKGNVDALKILIKHGADRNIKNKDHKTPLQLAEENRLTAFAYNDTQDAVEFLNTDGMVEAGKPKEAPLMIKDATPEQKQEMDELKQAQQHQVDLERQWFKVVADMGNDQQTVENINKFLDQNPNFNVNVKNAADKTAMHILADRDMANSLATLILKGGDTELAKEIAESTKGNNSASYRLLDAITSGNTLKTMTYILNSSVADATKAAMFNDLNTKMTDKERELLLSGTYDKDGNTALHMAAKRGEADLVAALVDAGADQGARNKQNKLPQDLSTNSEITHYLIETKSLRKDNVAQFAKKHLSKQAEKLEEEKNYYRTGTAPAADPLDKIRDEAGRKAQASSKAREDIAKQMEDEAKEKLASRAAFDATIHSIIRHSLEEKREAQLFQQRAQRDEDARSEAYNDAMKASKVYDLKEAKIVEEDLIAAKGLLTASAEGNLEKVKEILKDRPYLLEYHNGPSAPTALTEAASKGQTKVVEFLLDKGADIAAPGFNGNTALHMAALVGDTGLVVELMKRGANLHAVNADGNTAINLDIDQNMRNKLTSIEEAQSLFRSYIVKGEYAKAESALKTRPYLLNSPFDKDGNTLLHRAAENAQAASARKLIDLGADIHQKNAAGKDPYYLVVGKKDLASKSIAESIAREEVRREAAAKEATVMAKSGNFINKAVKAATAKIEAQQKAAEAAAIANAKRLNEEAFVAQKMQEAVLAREEAALKIQPLVRGNAGRKEAAEAKKLKEINARLQTQWFDIVDNGGNDQTTVQNINNFLNQNPDFNVNVKNASDETAMHILVKRNMADSLATLILKGGDTELAKEIAESTKGNNSASYRLLDAMKDNNKFRIAKYILTYPEDTELSEATKVAILNKKILNDLQDVFKSVILNSYYTFDYDDRNTPLHMAAKRGETALVKALVGAGDDMLKLNKKGKTPVDLAEGADVKAFFQDKIESMKQTLNESGLSKTVQENAARASELEEQQTYESFNNRSSSSDSQPPRAAGNSSLPKSVENLAKDAVSPQEHKPLAGQNILELATTRINLMRMPEVTKREKLDAMLKHFFDNYKDGKDQNGKDQNIEKLKENAKAALSSKNKAGNWVARVAKLGGRETDLEMFDRIIDNLERGGVHPLDKAPTQTKGQSHGQNRS